MTQRTKASEIDARVKLQFARLISLSGKRAEAGLVRVRSWRGEADDVIYIKCGRVERELHVLPDRKFAPHAEVD